MKKKHPANTRIQELMVFKAIIESGSLTKSSLALGLTQSGISKQLKVLREWFGDELFVRTAEGMQPTSKALAIAPIITTILREYDKLNGNAEFNPAELETSFIVSTTDDVQYYLLPILIEKMRVCAPKSKLIFKPLESEFSSKNLESGTVDLVIALNWQVPEHLKQRRLYSDDFVCLMRSEHPLLKKGLSLENYVSADHMMVSPLATGYSPIDELLAEQGHTRFVRLSVPNFMHVERILSNTDMIVTVPRTVANTLADIYPLTIQELPIQSKHISFFLFWHKRYDRDSANCWLRNFIYNALHKN